MIDRLLELNNQLELLLTLLSFIGAVLLGFYLVGRVVPIRLAVLIFGVGTAMLPLLAYRRYQSLVDYCRGSPEVEAGGDKLSCLEPYNWFAIQFELLVLLLAQLGLAVLLVAGLLHWWKRRRLREGRPLIQRT
jgi:hypothetical protein